MHTFSDIDRLKAMPGQHRPVDSAIVRNLREDLIVRWTYPSCAIEGNRLRDQKLWKTGVDFEAYISFACCEIFCKQACNFCTICKIHFNKPATPLYDAQLGGHFFAHEAWEGLCT